MEINPEDYIDLAWLYARRWSLRYGIDAEILLSYAYEIIHRCAQKYDPDNPRKAKFITYAMATLNASAWQHIQRRVVPAEKYGAAKGNVLASSLDLRVKDREMSRHSVIGKPDPEPDFVAHEHAQRVLGFLTPQERQVIAFRRHGLTLQQVGERMGVSPSRAQQIDAKARAHVNQILEG